MRNDKIFGRADKRINDLLQELRTDFEKEFKYEQLSGATVERLKENITKNIYRVFPEIKEKVKVEKGNIYVRESLAKECREIIYYLPYILKLKQNLPYDLYIEDTKVSQIEYEERLDPGECKYIVEIKETIKKKTEYITIARVN